MKDEFNNNSLEREKQLEKNQKAKEESEEITKPEGFVSKNVKLITFLICLGVFLAVLGPFGYFAVKNSRKPHTDTSKPAMTMNNIVGIAEADKTVTWNTIKGFSYEDRSTDDFKKWVFVIDNNYQVWAGGELNSDKPTYITLFNLNTGGQTEVRGADIVKFLDEQENK